MRRISSSTRRGAVASGLVLLLALLSAPAFGQEEAPDDGTEASETTRAGEAERGDAPDDGTDSESLEDEKGDDADARPEGFPGEPGEPADPFDDLQSRDTDAQPTKPIDAMTEAELREEGFLFSDRQERDGGSTAAILALTIGPAVHGVGHFYMGDETTGLVLLGLEAASILSILGLGIYALATGFTTSGLAVASTFFNAGVAGFFGSWALDIIGSIQGSTVQISEVPQQRRGMSVFFGYRLFDIEATPTRHAFDFGAAFDNDWVIAEVATTQDILLELQNYEAVLGSRPLVSGDNWAGAKAHGNYLRYTGTGEFGQLEVDGRLLGQLGLAPLSATLDRVKIGGALGWGRRWLQLPNRENRLEFGDGRGRLVYDFHARVGLTDRLELLAGLRSPSNMLLPVTSPVFGVAYFDLAYSTEGFGDLLLGIQWGDGLVFSAGGRFWLTR